MVFPAVAFEVDPKLAKGVAFPPHTEHTLCTLDWKTNFTNENEMWKLNTIGTLLVDMGVRQATGLQPVLSTWRIAIPFRCVRHVDERDRKRTSTSPRKDSGITAHPPFAPQPGLQTDRSLTPYLWNLTRKCRITRCVPTRGRHSLKPTVNNSRSNKDDGYSRQSKTLDRTTNEYLEHRAYLQKLPVLPNNTELKLHVTACENF